MALLPVSALTLSSCIGQLGGFVQPTVSAARIADTVKFLAAPEMRGRRVGTPEGARAADWIASRFADIGLAPAVRGSYFHEFPYGKATARNVAGIVHATGVGGRGQAAEYVVVGAHYDGIGDTKKAHRPAADDNATGVAGMLEIARAVVSVKHLLRRNVVFVAFDSEEIGLAGSTRFVLDEVIPTEATRFAMIFDLIGGRFFPWQEPAVSAMGTEHSVFVRSTIERLRSGRSLPVELLGTYVLEPAGPLMARSDYRHYRFAGVPYVFFSTGTPWTYHTKYDTIANVDFEQCAEIAQFALDVLLELTTHACEIDFIERPPAEVQDMVQLHRLIVGILSHRDAIHFVPEQFERFERMRDALAKAIERGRPSRLLAQRALILIFAAARQSGPEPLPKRRLGRGAVISR